MQDKIAPILKAIADLALQNQQAARKQEEYIALINAKLDHVAEELAIIKADTIIIKGVVLSDFSGVTQSTKEEIQTEAEAVKEHTEEILTAKE